MPVPTLVTDLSTTAASNYPQGSDSPATLDDVQRAHGSFIRSIYNVSYTAVGGTGSGVFVLATSPTLVTPALGTPTALVGTNITGTAANLTAGTATVANGIKSATTAVAVSAATAPTADQVLVASNSTTASWATPSLPQNSKSAAYTLVIGDGNKHIFHPSADTTARIWTIPANASVAFPIGTAVTFVNQNSGGIITISITTDTMRLAGTGSTGSRALAANGMATALKVTSTEWIISGTGLT